MIDWLSTTRREEKRKQADELKLRASLAEKLARYEATLQTNTDVTDEDDHTELMVNGKILRVSKTQIDLNEA